MSFVTRSKEISRSLCTANSLSSGARFNSKLNVSLQVDPKSPILPDCLHLEQVVDVLGQLIGTVDFEETRQDERSMPQHRTHPGPFCD